MGYDEIKGNLSRVVILLCCSSACFRLSNNGRHTSHDLSSPIWRTYCSSYFRYTYQSKIMAH